MEQISAKNLPTSSSVLVLGSSGNIGKATVYQLKKTHANVTAGIRDLKGKEALEFVKNGIKILQVDMNEKQETLAAKIKGFESVFINTPGHIDRVKITLNAARAVKEAGSQYLLTVSVPSVEKDILFGRQFKEIEEGIKKLGVTYGFIRLPMFVDNNFGSAGSITSDGVFYGPIPGDVEFTTVAVSDAAALAASLLTHYTHSKNQAFQVTSDKKSYDELAHHFSTVLGKPVKYVNAGYAEARKAFISLGIPEWQTDGILELYKLAESKDSSQTVLTTVYKDIIGHNPTSNLEWIKHNAVAFGGKAQTQGNNIIVLGASGYIGIPAVKALVAKKAHVTAGVRDTTKGNIKELEQHGVKVVKADMSQSQAELAAVLAHYNTLYIVTPGSIDRAKLTINAIHAAKEAKINYVLVVSVPSAGNNSILFGRQFGEIENALKSSGLNYGIIRLPFFIENTYGNADPIATHDTFYGPIDGQHKFSTVSVEDVGTAAAEILTNPEKHQNKTYKITSDYQTSNEQAKLFSKSLGREIHYVNAGYEGTKKALLAFMPEWQVDGVLELYQLVEKADADQSTASEDYKTITSKYPTSNEEWMKRNSAGFAKKSV